MSHPHLKVFRGPENRLQARPLVTISLGEMGPLLADAYRYDRAWLHDFQNQRVRIPSDLYEVLCAYGQVRPSA